MANNGQYINKGGELMGYQGYRVKMFVDYGYIELQNYGLLDKKDQH